MEQALLGLIATLIGAMIWTTKRLLVRSDEMAQKRDRDLQRSLDALEHAVHAFRAFERHEEEVHNKIVQRLDTGVETQKAILDQLERLHEHLGNGRS